MQMRTRWGAPTQQGGISYNNNNNDGRRSVDTSVKLCLQDSGKCAT